MRRPLTLSISILFPFALSAFYLCENFDDHDRRDRGEPFNLAADILRHTAPSVIFSQGDNYTFPLWFAQETMGVGKQHCVVDLSYLTVPEYVANLLHQGNLPLTAKEEDILYGAFSFTRVPEDADSTPVPLIDALRALYASKSDPPAFSHSRVTLPLNSKGDSVIIDLREFAAGSNRIPFRKLMLLDIMASATESEKKMDVRFLNRLTSELYKPFLPVLRNDTYSLLYSISLPENALDSLHAISHSSPRYADPLISEMVRQRRAEIIAAAERIAKRNPLRSAALLDSVAAAFPFAVHPAGVASIGDSYVYDGLEYVATLLDLAESQGDRERALKADRLCGEMIRDSEALNRYTLSLPPYRRSTVSASSRRIASLLPRLRQQKNRADSIISSLSNNNFN